jgi:hypothetical protein
MGQSFWSIFKDIFAAADIVASFFFPPAAEGLPAILGGGQIASAAVGAFQIGRDIGNAVGGSGSPSGSGSGSGNSFPPGSFPGGEVAGLPPGMTVAGPWGPGTNPFGSGLLPGAGAVALPCVLDPVCLAGAISVGLGATIVWELTRPGPVSVPGDFQYTGPHFVIQSPIITLRGKGNVADTEITDEANRLIHVGQPPDVCAALDQLMSAAKTAGDTARVLRIKRTQKAMGCRASRQSR